VLQNYLAESDGSNTINVVYTNEPRRYGNVISSLLQGAAFYHHFDATATTRQLTTVTSVASDKWIYDAWGNQVHRTGNTALSLLWLGQIGYYYDTATSHYSVRRRLYVPTLGRWSAIDPLEFREGFNRFGYVKNNPLTFSDPTGLVSGINSGPVKNGPRVPPNLSADYEFLGLAGKTLFMQLCLTFTVFRCRGCEENQRFVFKGGWVDLIQNVDYNTGIPSDEHTIDVEQQCADGPAGSECCCEGTWISSAACDFYQADKLLEGPQFPEGAEVYIKRFDESSYRTDCDGHGKVELRPPVMDATKLIKLLAAANVGVMSIMWVKHTGDGTFTVASQKCKVRAVHQFSARNYTPGPYPGF
jgi:RHS repeat-associated protein